MVSNPKFLIVDDNADSRFLLVKTLLRKFPTAAIFESQHAETATQIAQAENPHTIVVHRASGMEGLKLIPLLRTICTTAPIVYVSGIERTREALAAGATAFLNYDEWLRIGTLVQDLLREPLRPVTAPPFPSA